MFFTDNAITVLKKRYLKQREDGTTETPEELFRRVAESVAEADLKYNDKFDEAHDNIKKIENQFYEAMINCEFMPNSPTLMNAGSKLGQLSACFVLPVEDSMEGIFDAVKQAALIHKTGGGTGFSFSRLRPKNSTVKSTRGIASGPVSFMKVFNAATEAVKQGGTRRGANMGILRIDHPDIEDFITCKDDVSQITNFNISVALTEEFLKAVENDAEYNIYDPRDRSVPVGTKSAKKIFRMIAESAWKTGEPGVIFIDRINELRSTDEEIEATNPCGEQPLPPFDVCNLASINLSKCVDKHGVAWEKLRELVHLGVHFLDNVIDANDFPLPEIKEQCEKNRRIGLGVMGFADALIKLGIPYGSQESFAMGAKIMKFIQEKGHEYSSDLASTRGHFPNWAGSIHDHNNITMRNATVTTVAPTGTISIIAGCSSGIEPLYAIAYKRTVMEGTEMIEINPMFEEIAKKRGFFSEKLMDRIAAEGTIQHMEEIPEDVRKLFVVAGDLDVDQHVTMQAMFQQFCDSAVSKTINMPKEATVEDVINAYKTADEMQLKSISVYRDGSRPNQVLATGKTTREPVKSRPDKLEGFTEKIPTGYGNLYVTVNLRDNQPFEVFASIGKSGFSSMADTEGICRLASLALRAGVPVKEVIYQLKGIGGSQPVFGNGGRILSIPDAIGSVLHKYFGNGETHHEPDITDEFCPECLTTLVHDSGCIFCKECGYSKC